MKRRLAVGLALLLLTGGCREGIEERREDPRMEVHEGIREGDVCEPVGALGRTNTGKVLLCGKHGELDYATWGVGR